MGRIVAITGASGYLAARPKGGPRQRFLSWVFRSARRTKASMAVLPLMNLGKLGRIGDLFPWTSPRRNNIRYLPINASLALEDSVLPWEVIHAFIDRAAFHVIMDRCGCRHGNGCADFPHDLGCLFMGESAREIPPGSSHRATREEAHAHVERAIATGLVPLIGKVRVDNFIFQTPDRGRLLSVCFCCHCCCMMRSFKGIPASRLDRVIRPLEGVAIDLDGAKCRGCATCMATCPFGAISIVDGKAVHGEACRKCGRCARYCPKGAVGIRWDREGFPENVIRSIESSVEVG